MENGEKEDLLPKTPEEAYIILRDGRDISGQMKDGTVETVKVRIVSQEKMSNYAEAVLTGDEPGELAHYIEATTPEFRERMTPWFLNAVLGEGQRLNFPLLEPFLDRRIKRMKLLGKASPEFQALAEKMTSTLKEQFTTSSSRQDTAKPSSGPIPRAS